MNKVNIVILISYKNEDGETIYYWVLAYLEPVDEEQNDNENDFY